MEKPKAFIVQVPTNRTKVVAIRSISDSTVVAHGTKAEAVSKKVSGFNPVIMHVPEQGKKYVY